MKDRLIFWTGVTVNISAVIFYSWQQELFHWVNGILLSGVVTLIMIRARKIRLFYEWMKLTGQKVRGTQSDVHDYIVKSKQLADEVDRIISGINDIGQDGFTGVLQKMDDVIIRQSLQTAHEKIISLRQKENETNWITQGIAAITGLKYKQDDVPGYSFLVVSTIVKYLNANQGSFFLLKQENEDAYFELTASYAYNKKKFIEKRINPGEGLVGQVFYEKDIIYLTDVPQDYVKITSGLGESLPRCICIVPLLSEGKIYGAIEIASFVIFTPAQMEYLRRIGESIGYTLGSMEVHVRTEKLLKESRAMGQELKTQEEELRQKMEELAATQEQMKRRQAEMDAVLSSLSTVEIDLHGNILGANPVFLSITGYTLKDIQGKAYKNLIPNQGNDMLQYDLMWSSIIEGRTFSGEFRMLSKEGSEMWMMGNYTPITDGSGKPYKIMIVSQFTTQDKQKLLELQEAMSAIKSFFPMVEIIGDMTFRSANELFLNELGIRRIELRNFTPQNVLVNDSYYKVEAYMKGKKEQQETLPLEFRDKTGSIKKFSTSLIGLNHEAVKKTLLLLRNALH